MDAYLMKMVALLISTLLILIFLSSQLKLDRMGIGMIVLLLTLHYDSDCSIEYLWRF